MKPGRKKSPQQRANLRTCASCRWIFEGSGACPKCEFCSYGARFVYGDACYRFKVTQEPWMNQKLDSYKGELLDQIEKSKPAQNLNFLSLGDP